MTFLSVGIFLCSSALGSIVVLLFHWKKRWHLVPIWSVAIALLLSGLFLILLHCSIPSCPNCDHKVDTAYCGDCGYAIKVTCPGCSEVIPADDASRFCPDCGYQLTDEEVPS